MTHLDFLIQLIICIVPLEMLSIWRNHMISVIPIATRKHKSWFKFYHIQSGVCMDILPVKEMDRLEILGLGSLMLVPYPASHTSTRTRERNQQSVYGLLSMLVQRFMLVTKE